MDDWDDIDEEIKKKFTLDLLKKRKIYLTDRINSYQADEIAKMLLWLNSQGSAEIILYINSSGGNVEAGFDIYDIIRHSESPVSGIVFKEASSMAALVLQACAPRNMMKHAVMAFHLLELNLAMDWMGFKGEAEKRIEEIRKAQADYENIVAGRIGIEAREIRILCEKKKILSASEAKEMGFIDEILMR